VAGSKLKSGVALGTTATRADLWRAFCASHRIALDGVPLFSITPSGQVDVILYGRNARPILRRSDQMQALVRKTVEGILAAPPGQADGLLYMMYRLGRDDEFIPIYIGKAERRGRSGAAVSANIASIETDHGKFARWGYNYAYHLGELSAAALPGHPPEKRLNKYQNWARHLFKTVPSDNPQPRFDIRFWCCAWGPASVGIWPEIGACPLAFAEHLVIGVAGLLFPGDLLNDEGVNRKVSYEMQPNLD
jgi:hypothetical protein